MPLDFDSIDEYILGPMFGYKGSKDYRQASSTVGLLHKIKVPTLFLHAWDDAFMNPESIPLADFSTNPNIVLATTKAGSHGCHFVGGGLGGLLPTTWHYLPIMEFMMFNKKHKAD